MYQGLPKEFVHAISLCKDFVRDSKFVVYLNDNMLQNKEFVS